MDNEKSKLVDAYRDALAGKAYQDERERARTELVKAEDSAKRVNFAAKVVTAVVAFICIVVFAPTGHSFAWYGLATITAALLAIVFVEWIVDKIASRRMGVPALTETWETVLNRKADRDGVRRAPEESALLGGRFGACMDVLERTRRAIDAVERGLDVNGWQHNMGINDERLAELAWRVEDAREKLMIDDAELEAIWQHGYGDGDAMHAALDSFDVVGRVRHILEPLAECIPTVVIHAKKPVF